MQILNRYGSLHSAAVKWCSVYCVSLGYCLILKKLNCTYLRNVIGTNIVIQLFHRLFMWAENWAGTRWRWRKKWCSWERCDVILDQILALAGQMSRWWTKNASHSIMQVIPLCSINQAPSYQPNGLVERVIHSWDALQTMQDSSRILTCSNRWTL